MGKHETGYSRITRDLGARPWARSTTRVTKSVILSPERTAPCSSSSCTSSRPLTLRSAPLAYVHGIDWSIVDDPPARGPQEHCSASHPARPRAVRRRHRAWQRLPSSASSCFPHKRRHPGRSPDWSV